MFTLMKAILQNKNFKKFAIWWKIAPPYAQKRKMFILLSIVFLHLTWIGVVLPCLLLHLLSLIGNIFFSQSKIINDIDFIFIECSRKIENQQQGKAQQKIHNLFQWNLHLKIKTVFLKKKINIYH